MSYKEQDKDASEVGSSPNRTVPSGSRTTQTPKGNMNDKAEETTIAESETDSPAVSVEQLIELIETLQGKNAELEDQYLRLAAEFDNYKKRQSRVFSEMITAAQDALILKVLDILDNFERALETNDNESEPESIVEGVRLIHKQLQDLLASENIEVICPDGECFDPNLHEALSAVNGDVESDTVTEVVQKGYRRGDKLVRPAKVVVTKPKPEEDE